MSDHSDDSCLMPDENDNLYKMAKTGVLRVVLGDIKG
jgi:hypothetical protein